MSFQTTNMLPVEMQLALSCTRVNPTAEESLRTRELLRKEVNWDLFLAQLQIHGIAPLAFRLLAAEPAMPQEQRERLRDIARNAALQNMILTQHLLDLCALFRTENLEVMPYKGPALSAFLYGDSTIRESSDLDFLIRPQSFIRFRDLLLAQGFQPEEKVPPLVNDRYMAWRNECGFIHLKRAVRVDVHWKITPRHLGVHIDPEWLWNGASQLSVNGVAMPALAAEKLVLALAVHGAHHGWGRMQWICDLGNLLRSSHQINWGEMAESSHRIGADQILALGLTMAHQLLGAPCPEHYYDDEFIQKLAEKATMILRDAKPGKPEARRRWLLLLRLQPGWRARLRSLFSYFSGWWSESALRALHIR